MLPSIDYSTASFDELFNGVHMFGSSEQKQRSDELILAYHRVGEDRMFVHSAMRSLMATVEWEHSFSDEAKKDRHEIVRRNFGLPEPE